SLKTSIKTITYLSDIGCLEIHGASLAIIWLLLGQSVNYFFVLGVLLVSSIAGVIVHIPAGIGVLEAVFIALLAGEHTSKGSIIAALLAYRVLYYFIPLLLALICYLLLESQAKKLRAKNEAAM
ncbi:hypothetical protein MQA04_21870, partial [Escherichia coli]|nr:hypothetical protein [Escherichia coli]